MKLELQAKLLHCYPKFFRKPGEGCLQEELTPFDERGIECGDGWFAIIDRLSRACEVEITMLISQGLDKECWPRVAQIKEKLGGLRFYLNGRVSDQLRSQILQAEADDGESFRTCEHCGAAGRLRGGSWMHTCCDSCDAESEANRHSSAH